jgi:tricorn protease
MLAYTGEVDGNRDVYLLPIAGGPARRLTFHPGEDEAVGYTPDGKRVVFRSSRQAYARGERLHTVPIDGGLAEVLPLPYAFDGSYSPDGARLAYVPFTNLIPRRAIKRYRGGLSPRVWIAELKDSKVTKLPSEGSNDSAPMWIGEKIYFLSDRAGKVALFSYDLSSRQVKQLLSAEGEDILSASAGPGAIALERLSGISLYDVASGAEQPIAVRIAADLPQARPRWVKAGERIVNTAISPTGARVAFEARGDIFTVPAEKGDVRNLTKTSDAAERTPAWSRDGKWLAYFSDQSGEYALYVRRSDGSDQPRKIDLGLPPSFFYDPVFSPDGKWIAYGDKRLQLWVVELEGGKTTLLDKGEFAVPGATTVAAWSPDSRWLVWSRSLKSRYHALFARSIDAKKTVQLTDGFSDARNPQFDESGKYLYFTASTDSGPTLGWLDMSTQRRPTTSSAYLMVLRKDLPSPLEPENDEEKGVEAKKDETKGEKKEEKKEPVKIDLDGLSQRILALPLPARRYTTLRAGKTGVVYLAEAPTVSIDDGPDGPELIVQRFDLAKRKAEKVAEGVFFFDVSADGGKMVVHTKKKWFVTAADAPVKPDATPLRIEEMESFIDPRAEWKQMYREVWRVQRDFFYDPGLHGVQLIEAMKNHEKYLAGMASRRDLTFLFHDMLGEFSVQHMYVYPPPPEGEPRKGGLLGADYRIENGRYRIERIYQGENWNPGLRAPLTEPGVNVSAGDYILAIDGRELRPSNDIDELLQGTAEHTVQLKVAKSANGEGARTVSVVPAATEAALRQRAWMEANRRKVDELSGGRLAYVYLPNTATAGFVNFNRYYYAQTDKQGLVVDERFNGGGQAADYIIDQLRRPLLSHWTPRDGMDFTTPTGAIFGPKVMLINQFAGSGGDALPWYFKREKIGPLVGTRTWGGLVGIGGQPVLLDGGNVTSPWFAFFTPEGEWDVENRGVAPDVEVDLDPAAWREGKDLQLEKAVEILLAELKKHPPPAVKHPPFPNYQRKALPSARK